MCDLENLADVLRFPFENDDLVRPGAPHQPRRIRPARPFAQNLDIAPDQALVRAVRGCIDNAQQILIALLLSPAHQSAPASSPPAYRAGSNSGR